MKNAVKDESTVSIRVIYDRYLTSLQDQNSEYKLYTQTSEFKPFLQYDNKKKAVEL